MDTARARFNMVEGQIRTNKVTDDYVLNAMGDMPREDYLPEGLKAQAYIDEDVIVGPGRIMMDPMILARMVQTLAIEDTDVALVVGAATGYEAALISRLASAVVALESQADLVKLATDNLSAHGADTVSVVAGDLALGLADQAPYDVIFVNGAVDEVPAELSKQLAEGGRMVCVVNTTGAPVGAVQLVTKTNGVLSTMDEFDAFVPALPEFAAQPKFSF